MPFPTYRFKPEGWRAGGGPAWLAILLLLAVLSSGAGCRDPSQTVTSGNTGEAGKGSREGVEGRVTAPDGKPVPGAFVQAESLDEPAPPIPEIAVLTGEDGRYLWPLSPGRYRITVSADGYQPTAGTATVEAGRLATLNLALPRSP
jgi:hypothetical protein